MKKKKKPYMGRNIWGMRPVTQVVPNKKAYNRKRKVNDYDDRDSTDSRTDGRMSCRRSIVNGHNLLDVMQPIASHKPGWKMQSESVMSIQHNRRLDSDSIS